MRNWAMRFEAKHHYFKRLVGTINNFKNIELSLARRHQALQAYLLQSSSGNFLKMSLEHGPTGKYYISITGYLAVLLKRIPPLQIPHLLPL